MNNLIVQDEEFMKDIIRFLEQFGTERLEEVKVLYAAIYYLFKIRIFEYPKESIIFYIYSSYDLASKNVDFKNEKNTPEFIFELYKNSNLQNQSSILTNFTNFIPIKIPKNEFCVFFQIWS